MNSCKRKTSHMHVPLIFFCFHPSATKGMQILAQLSWVHVCPSWLLSCSCASSAPRWLLLIPRSFIIAVRSHSVTGSWSGSSSAVGHLSVPLYIDILYIYILAWEGQYIQTFETVFMVWIFDTVIGKINPGQCWPKCFLSSEYWFPCTLI